MDVRATILQKAVVLLAQAPSGDVSTRAVCDAAGVTQPVLYRLFGDKAGLMAAVVDEIWGEYLAMKRAAEKSADPVEDLRRGWDSHTAFALKHPHAYRLMFGSALAPSSYAARDAMQLLRDVLDRIAEQGRLRVPPADAAQIVMAANTGFALALILRPESYPDAAISTSVRDAVHRGILVAESSAPENPAAVAATTLRAHLTTSETFSPAETSLLDEWLTRIEPH